MEQKSGQVLVRYKFHLDNESEIKPLETPFPSPMSLRDARKLQVGDKIDHQDTDGRFLGATVIEKIGSDLKIHYDGWNSKWDVWSNYVRELRRFAVAGSISKRRAHRFKHLEEGDLVEEGMIIETS